MSNNEKIEVKQADLKAEEVKQPEKATEQKQFDFKQALRNIKKKLQTEGIFVKIKENSNGFIKETEKRKIKKKKIIAKKKAQSLTKVRKNKIVKTPYIVENEIFKIEITEQNINIYDQKNPNKLFANYPIDPEKKEDSFRVISEYL